MTYIRTKEIAQKGWFLTDNGRRYSSFGANLVGTSVILGHILPHTALVSEYRDFVRLYSNGFSVPVPDTVVQRFAKTLELLQIDQVRREQYTPFMTCGFDMFSAGTYGRFGVHIGIPVNFSYKSIDTIDKSKILINQESVVWESNAGKQLIKSLVVPESAQMYAMAREIKMRDSFKLFLDTFYAMMGVTLTYLGSAALNKKMDLYTKPRQLRYCGYAVIAILNLGNYLMCKDFTQNMYEEKIDEELKALSPVFAEGGKQFYTHILERNKALRVLMGKEGESVYTILGNENYLLRSKHRPLVQRKAFFEEQSEHEQANVEAV